MLEITFAKRTNTGRWATGLFIYIASPITAFKVEYEQYQVKRKKNEGLTESQIYNDILVIEMVRKITKGIWERGHGYALQRYF